MEISQDTFERLEHRHMISGSLPVYHSTGITYNCEDLSYRSFNLNELKDGSYTITDFNDRLLIELVEVL